MVSLLHYFYFSFIRSDSILRFAAEDYRAAIQPTERRVKVVSTGIYILFNLDAQLLFDTVLLAVAVFFLFMLMSYLLFNPARKLLKDRQDRIESDINTAVADKESAAALKAEYEGKLKDIDKEAEAILTEARQKALKTRTRLWMMQGRGFSHHKESQRRGRA